MEGVEFTTVVGIDVRYYDQFRLTYPTWVKHKREIREQPLVVIADTRERSYSDWRSMLETWLDHPEWKLTAWEWGPEGVPQRERMLTAFVRHAPFVVWTPYWLKIDTDAVASSAAPWIFPEWFDDKPAIVAAGWPYTKPASCLPRIEAWADTVPELSQYPRMDFRIAADSETYAHRRIGSWLSFFDTEWTRRVAAYVPDRLPIPSEDTYHWYCATRTGRTVRRIGFKSLGWANWHTQRTREAKVAEALA